MTRSLVLAAVVLCSFGYAASRSHAAINVQGFAFGTEDPAIAGFTIEDFEDVNLIPGLSITFSGGVASQTYNGTLNQVWDPVTASNQFGLGGPFTGNTWDGQNALTNGGHGAGLTGSSPGNGNFWDFDFASSTRFSVPSVQAFGIGLSNFQSLSLPFGGLTDHTLIVNGSTSFQLENIPGWQPGANERNLYVLVSATGSDSISSIDIQNDTAADGLVFDKLAVPGSGVIPELSSLTVWSLLAVGGIGFAYWRQQGIAAKHRQTS